MSFEQREEVFAHIESFPKYISHYCRKVTSAKFLSGNLTLTKMYELLGELGTRKMDVLRLRGGSPPPTSLPQPPTPPPQPPTPPSASSIYGKVGKLQTYNVDISSLDVIIGRISDDVSKINAGMTTLQKRIDQRIDGVESKINEVKKDILDELKKMEDRLGTGLIKHVINKEISMALTIKELEIDENRNVIPPNPTLIPPQATRTLRSQK